MRSVVESGYDLVSRAYRGDDFDGAGTAYRSVLDWVTAQLAPASRVLDLGCGCGIPVAAELSASHAVLGVDISRVQLERARRLVTGGLLVRADLATVDFAERSFDGAIALYSLIHVPVERHRQLLGRIARWVRPGGVVVLSAGEQAWTGTEEDWLGVPGAKMYWSHADRSTYRTWIERSGLRIEEERFVEEGSGGHPFFYCRRSSR